MGFSVDCEVWCGGVVWCGVAGRCDFYHTAPGNGYM